VTRFPLETRSSFTVDLVRGLWQCYGCDAHGDVINLMAMLENITVAEAIRVMARRLPAGGCGA
jgi:DNA primase